MFYKSSIASFLGAERKQVESVSVNIGSDFTCTSFVRSPHMHASIFNSNFERVYFSWGFRMDTQPHKPVIFSSDYRSAADASSVCLMNDGTFVCVSLAFQQEGICCATAVHHQ